MQITKLLHTALLVSDLDRAKDFYGNLLGLSQVERPLKYPGAWYQLGEVQVHLIAASAVGETVTNFEKLGRNRHIAFAVTDLNAMKAKLLAQRHACEMSASGRAALFVQDPDGNVIELSQL